MISKLGFSPDRVSPPGNTIINLMDEHGITNQEFSKKIGLSLKKGQQLLSGDISLDENLAYRLNLFDVSSDFWLRRESTYKNTLHIWIIPIKHGLIPSLYEI
ncbi:transcriptional regulator [Providencia hangzhouensis]|uniref:helix-turn-helix transcriptional regulator n=1 Tax=Providencia hangzhouensis TaxID=3031799 RepID=UPI0034DD1F50